MKVTSWNLLHGMQIPPDNSGAATGDGLRTGLSTIREFAPDVIGIQEVDQNQARSSHVNQTELVATEIGASFWAFSPTLMEIGRAHI